MHKKPKIQFSVFLLSTIAKPVTEPRQNLSKFAGGALMKIQQITGIVLHVLLPSQFTKTVHVVWEGQKIMTGFVKTAQLKLMEIK